MTELTCLNPPQPTPFLKRFPSFTLSHAQKDLIAGSLAGFCIVLTGHPLEYFFIEISNMNFF